MPITLQSSSHTRPRLPRGSHRKRQQPPTRPILPNRQQYTSFTKTTTMKLSGKLAILCCSLALIAACKKNGDGNSMSSQKKLLTAGKWLITAGTVTTTHLGIDYTVDRYAPMDACDKDDFVLFATNGTGTIDESTDKCAADGQVESFKWALLDNDARLALIDSNPDTFTLAELTTTQMKIQTIKPNSSGDPVTSVWTYKNIK